MRKSSAIAFSPASAIVIMAVCYTALLCFINTHVAGISNMLVALVDGAILLAALVFALQGGPRALWMLLLALAANILLLALFSERIDAKAARDLLAPIAFTALGLRYGTFEQGARVFYLSSAIIIAFAMFEFIWPSAYIAVFNILDFYTARGMVDANTLQRLDTAFFISGARDGERMLLPFLGPHRVSSVFLEPVSMGNFGAIAVVFALSMSRAHWRAAVIAAVIGVTAIVLADARFASMAAIFFVLARLVPAHWRQIGLAFMPLICIALLIGFALSDLGHGDDLPTRLALSGRVLLDLPPTAIFGIAPYGVPTYDAGYAYALSAFGLPMCALLWSAYVLLPTPTEESSRYKFLLGVYICALLCISGTSVFALKTAALAFYVLGALAAYRLPQHAWRKQARPHMVIQERPA